MQEYSLSSAQEFSETLLYSAVAFSLPLLLGHEQLLVGSAVNCALVLAALNLRGARLLPVILFPSLGALLAGVLFGGLTPALAYMVPFIWAGNAALVLFVKEFALRRSANKLWGIGVSAIAKASLLFACAGLLFVLGAVPAQFLAAFGAFQLVTALAGGTAALLLQSAKKSLFAARA